MSQPRPRSKPQADAPPTLTTLRYDAAPVVKVPINLAGLGHPPAKAPQTPAKPVPVTVVALPVLPQPKADQRSEGEEAPELPELRYHLPDLRLARAAQKRRQYGLMGVATIVLVVALAGVRLALLPVAHPALAPAAGPAVPVARVALVSHAQGAIAHPAAPKAVPSFPGPNHYRVRRGDDLSDIAHRHHISVRAIQLSNPGIESSYDLRVGHMLLLPPIDGFYHRVVSGDTVGYLAEHYGVSPHKLLAENPGLTDLLHVGQLVFIGRIPPEAPAIQVDRSRPRRYHLAHRGLLEDLGRAISEHFRWPFAGTISSGFGWRDGGREFHKGVDILAPTGTPIHASRGGTVAYSGWMEGYGNCILLDNGGGVETRYAHCSKLEVHVGEHVDAGDTIGLVGMTGDATAPHCHFEIIVNGRPVNPAGFGI